MDDVNMILETIRELGAALLTFSAFNMLLIQYGKEKLKLKDTAAEIFSIIVSAIPTVGVALVYVNALNWELSLGQIVGVILYVIAGVIGPAGGYKLLGTLSGKRLSA